MNPGSFAKKLARIIPPALDPAYHAHGRSRTFFFQGVAVLAIVAGLAVIGWLPLPAEPTLFVFGVFAIAMATTRWIYDHYGFDSLAYSAANWLESEIFLAGLCIEVALASGGHTYLGAFYILMAVLLAQSAGNHPSVLAGVAAPILVVVAFAYHSELPVAGERPMLWSLAGLSVVLAGFFGSERVKQIGLLELAMKSEHELNLTRVNLDAERRLRDVEKDWLSTLEQATAALYVMDRNGLCLTYRESGQAPGLRRQDGSLEIADLYEVLRRIEATGVPASIYGQPATESERYLDIRIVPLPLRDQERRFAVLAQDATDRVEFERKNRELQEHFALADRMVAMGTLSAGVAHEINNPLTYISGNLEYLLSREDLPESYRSPLEDIQSGFAQVASIVQGLKRLSHPTPSRTFEAVDLVELVQRVHRLVAADFHHLTQLQVEVPDRPVMVSCRPDEIVQVLLNLLINARQALPERPRDENRIIVRVVSDEISGTLSVEDNGAGIPADRLRRIFDPFFTTKSPGSGTGLGLSVSYHIATEHGGQLRVYSKENEGSTFTLSLPLAGNIETRERRPILIVDDEVRTLTLFRNVLRDFAVTTAASVHEALPYLKQPFSAVLCDIRLGDGTGPELLRAAPDALRERFLFLTALPPGTAELADLPPGVRVLQKPIALEELRRQLHAVASRSDAHGRSLH